MKARQRSGFLTVLTASFGLAAALFAAGCAAEPDETDASGPAPEAVVAEEADGGEGSTEGALKVGEAGHLHGPGLLAGCKCGICIGGMARSGDVHVQ